ncbi:SH3 domain-containing protein 2 isoform X1 [Syzygium oleosum]|uniref:SH3 domain-containing protein 2 isoform X1 n=1 Tax=Syzygium oleosum TaxID=219896 RepID=UPI0011D20110|nr:SH3 domain-containing protein 2 isoform X1 [Syzygium oleosum]
MEAIKKQASKLREQVAKQQQAILKQLGHFDAEALTVDEDELQCYRQLQNLYNSTRVAKHLQRNIVRGVEGFISISSKQMEIVRKLADDCCNYGVEKQGSGSALARAALSFGTSHNSMESERKNLLGTLGDQVSEPLRVVINGAPLEDARHLTRRYDKLRQEVENQAAEVLRRGSRSRDSAQSAESSLKLKSAEARLTELKSAMMALGREATDAMLSVEDQQQQITFQRLLKMVDAERDYHRRVVAILEKLHSEMIEEEQSSEPSVTSTTMQPDGEVPLAHEDAKSSISDDHGHIDQYDSYFIGKVIHPFDAEAEGELSLSVDDYVIVRQVAPNGWSEGESNGNAGWFPSAYVERQEKAPAKRVLDTTSSRI